MTHSMISSSVLQALANGIGLEGPLLNPQFAMLKEHLEDRNQRITNISLSYYKNGMVSGADVTLQNIAGPFSESHLWYKDGDATASWQSSTVRHNRFAAESFHDAALRLVEEIDRESTVGGYVHVFATRLIGVDVSDFLSFEAFVKDRLKGACAYDVGVAMITLPYVRVTYFIDTQKLKF